MGYRAVLIVKEHKQKDTNSSLSLSRSAGEQEVLCKVARQLFLSLNLKTKTAAHPRPKTTAPRIKMPFRGM